LLPGLLQPLWLLLSRQRLWLDVLQLSRLLQQPELLPLLLQQHAPCVLPPLTDWHLLLLLPHLLWSRLD
jgi:hypothetical protein